MKTRISISSGGGGGGASAFFSSSPPSVFPSTPPPPSFPSSAFFSSFFSSLALGFSSTAAGSFFPCSAFFASYHETIHLLYKNPHLKLQNHKETVENGTKTEKGSTLHLSHFSNSAQLLPGAQRRQWKPGTKSFYLPSHGITRTSSLSGLSQCVCIQQIVGSKAANVSIRNGEGGTCETDGSHTPIGAAHVLNLDLWTCARVK